MSILVDSDSGALSCMCVWCPSRLSMLLSRQSGNGRTICDQVNVQWSCGDVTSAGGGFAYIPVRNTSKQASERQETRETELHLRRPRRLCTCSDYCIACAHRLAFICAHVRARYCACCRGATRVCTPCLVTSGPALTSHASSYLHSTLATSCSLVARRTGQRPGVPIQRERRRIDAR